MTQGITVNIAPMAYEQIQAPWLANRKPYPYQHKVYELIREALANKETLCLFLITPTGSGKTLASYAYSINSDLPTIGVYPTNELIRDQERALKPWLDLHDNQRLLRVDSKQLDEWQVLLEQKQHATTLETLINWRPTILTNPDILFYTFFGLYRGPSSVQEHLFARVGEYSLFIFDEFHLYNVKQMADVAFLIGALQAINPDKGRVFIFASATPESPALNWLRDQLGLRVETVAGTPSPKPEARVIAHPLELTILPADLRRWQAIETLLGYLPSLQQFVTAYPPARLVTILDSVAGAINFAQLLRDTFPDKSIGEVHGFSSDEERELATQQVFTVGTSTIEVGIDFQDKTEKDLLIFEARTASQFIQRFGRLARHQKSLPIPNRVVSLVPEYVFHFFAERATADQTLSRSQLYELVEEAYQSPQDFARYLQIHAPAEFHEACQFVGRMFQADDQPRISQGLGETIKGLTGSTAEKANSKHRRYEIDQILSPLLTFRGSGFEVAILDERGSDIGFPAKRYNLMFLLSRGIFTELDEAVYLQNLERLESTWPAEVARERHYYQRIKRSPKELLGVYGYFKLTGLRDKARKNWFEIGEDEIYGRKGIITTITGLEIATEPEVRLKQLNRHLRRKKIVAWFIDQHPASIKLGRALPPLFAIYELRVRRLSGRLSDSPWSIAFNQDAFFVDSLGWYMQQKEDNAIIL